MKSYGRVAQVSGVAVATLLLLVVGMLIEESLPYRDDLVFSTFDYGTEAPMIGEVTDVRATLTNQVNGALTNGRWLVIDFARTPEESMSLIATIDIADGRSFSPVNSLSATCGHGYPGLKEECPLVFEMPVDFKVEDLSDAHLVLLRANTRMSPQSKVPIASVSEEKEVVREGISL